VAALIFAHYQHRPTPSDLDSSSSRTLTCSSIIGHTSLVILLVVAVGGWWYIRNGLLYDDPFGFQVHADTLWGRDAPASLDTILSELPRLYRSFWGSFGWGHVLYPRWIYLALGGGVIISLIGWAWTLKTRRLPGQGRAFLLAAAWWLVVLAALLQWMRQVEAPHGRLLFPAIGAWAVLLVGGWAALPLRRLPYILLIGLAALSLLTPWTTIHPAFASPRLITPAEAASTVEGEGLIYGDTARLLGITLNRPSASPGEWLEVRACWEAIAPMAQDYTVFVHLVGREDARVAERYTYPGLGRFPTSLWPIGRAFCDTYRLRVEEWTPVPELYDLVIGLYDAPTGERLNTRYPDGAAADFPMLTQVRVAPEQPLAVSPQHPLDYWLGKEIALSGVQLSTPIQSNEPLTVTLYWRADEAPQGDYVAFVHLLDDAGQLLAQHDSLPRYGRYPTLAWHPGDIIPDEHTLEVPELSVEQRVHLVAGMYHPDTMERLPVLGPDGPVSDGLVPLLTMSP
jgi:hypothetical protein